MYLQNNGDMTSSPILRLLAEFLLRSPETDIHNKFDYTPLPCTSLRSVDDNVVIWQHKDSILNNSLSLILFKNQLFYK